LIRKLQLLLISLIVGAGSLPAQEPGRTLEFHFEDRAIVVPRFGPKVEALPVLELVGGEVKYSLSAGTYGVISGEHVIQFAVDHKVLLIDGDLMEAQEKPVASPGGVAVSLGYLERYLLSPLGFHLEPVPRGYRIVRGARFADPVTVRPAVADFGVTTTLVLTLNRPTEAEVEELSAGLLAIRFADATPHWTAAGPSGHGGSVHSPARSRPSR